MISYSVAELKHLIKESANEFKPVIGPNVTKDDASSNKKTYSDAKKRAQDYDGGLKDPKNMKLNPKADNNRTTLDYIPSNEPDETYKKRVEAQGKGYTSELEEKSKTERNGEFDENGKILKQFEDNNNDINDIRSKRAHSGLVSQHMPKTPLETNRLYEDNKPKAKRLKFKNTRFLNEGMMLSKIPEAYKEDGQIIYMKDGYDNEYIVECAKSEKSGMMETNVIKYQNKTIMNEQLNRINELMSFGSPKNSTSQSYNEKINEKSNFQEMMDIARSANKK